jgi:hypothetical protein
VLALVFAVLAFVPLVPHLYIQIVLLLWTAVNPRGRNRIAVTSWGRRAVARTPAGL